VHFDELGGAGMLFANNQRCGNAVPLHPKALLPLLKTVPQTKRVEQNITMKHIRIV